MGRKSSISKLSPQVRSHIEKCLRQDRLTLDELIAELQEKFPDQNKPSRSALGRYSQSFESMMEQIRQQEQMARIMVEELGENPDDKAGALLVQSVTTLANRVLFESQGDADLDVEDVRKLARAAKDIMHTRKLSLEQRREVERLAREKLIEEQEQGLEELRGTDGMSEQLEDRIRKVLLGKA